MRTRWFGAEPWNTTLCDPDYHVPAPVGTKCLECTKPVKPQDRGVITACSPRIWGHWTLRHNDQHLSVCSYHLGCFLAIVTGEETEGTRVEERARGAQATLATPINTSVPDFTQPTPEIGVDDQPPPLEDAEPGRGWKR